MSGNATPYAVEDDVAFRSDGLRRRHFTAAGAALPARVRRGENPPRPEVRAHPRPGEQWVSCLDRPAIRDFRSVRSLDGFEPRTLDVPFDANGAESTHDE